MNVVVRHYGIKGVVVPCVVAFVKYNERNLIENKRIYLGKR